MTSAIPWLAEERTKGMRCRQINDERKALEAKPLVMSPAISAERLLALLAIAEAAHHDVFIREYLDGIQSALDKASKVP